MMGEAYLAGGALVAAALAYGACGWVRRTGVLDAPDGARKLQNAPVPSSGGVGFVPAAFVAWIAPLTAHAILKGFPALDLGRSLAANWSAVWGLTAFALVLGWLDDLGRAPTVLKFALLALASLAVSASGVAASSVPTPFGHGHLPVLAAVAGSALWLFVVMNAVNFMDGANGLSMGGLGVMLVSLGAAAWLTHPDVFALPVWAFAGALGGFLIWNLPGRLYAGDAGALAGGALFAAASLWLVSRGAFSVWTPATLALPFLVDVFLTLWARARRGENLLVAHRDHAYQRLIDSGWSHLRTARLYWGFSLFCGLSALIAMSGGDILSFTVFWALTAVGSALWLAAPEAASTPD
ncbi:MAG: hypothetical protein AAFQ67_03385 [Pseudomonadota bacterium]